MNNDHQTAQAGQSPLISVEHLCWKTDANVILNDISLAVKKGSFTGILGPNGAGKSSLLRCLYRYLKPSSGSVKFDGQDIWQFSANDYAKLTAVVLQETPSHFNLTVFDVVALGLIPHKGIFTRASKADHEKIVTAIEQVGLADKIEQSFEHLSGGEKQRVLIARAIVQSPQLLLMDEPTSHLDVRYQIQIMELAKSLGITVIASFHDLNLASAICDNLIVINKGQLVKQGPPEQVITKEMLSEVFGVCAEVTPHHHHNVPHISYYYGYVSEPPKQGHKENTGGNQ